MKGLVFAALKVLDPGFLERDIMHLPSTSPSDATADSQLSDSRTHTKTNSLSIIVRLSSPDLMLNLINAKIKMGKLHSSQLSVELLELAKVTAPLPTSLMNINEWLPAELHQLRSLAWTQAKKKGFISYVRSGRIYIKKKKEDQATVIASIEELNNLLG